MPLCPAGSSPKSSAPATYWITAQDIIGWVGQDQYSRLAPWVWNLPDALYSIPALCQSEPEQPPAITDGDIFLAGTNPISAIALQNRLAAFGKWWVWSQQCQCNAVAACTTITENLVLGQNLQFNPNGPGFVYPTNTPGISTDVNEPYLPIPPGCTTVNVTPYLIPTSGAQPQLVFYIADCVGQLYYQSHIFGQPEPVTIRAGTCANGQPGIAVRWFWNVDPTNYPNWQLTIAPLSGSVGPPTPAPPPSVTNITVAPFPAPGCSDPNAVCQIIWNIKNNTSLVQNNTYLSLPPTAYQGGTETIIQGQGEFAVASGTLALSVTVLANPPSLDPRPDDPAEYWNLGWIRTGNAVGWDRKAWIRTSGQRVFPPWPSFDRFAWTLADGVILNVQELMPIT
jgi:hypothetical protein